jgi:hypothetical protein
MHARQGIMVRMHSQPLPLRAVLVNSRRIQTEAARAAASRGGVLAPSLAPRRVAAAPARPPLCCIPHAAPTLSHYNLTPTWFSK